MSPYHTALQHSAAVLLTYSDTAALYLLLQQDQQTDQHFFQAHLCAFSVCNFFCILRLHVYVQGAV